MPSCTLPETCNEKLGECNVKSVNKNPRHLNGLHTIVATSERMEKENGSIKEHINAHPYSVPHSVCGKR